jgi:hypothetical protein
MRFPGMCRLPGLGRLDLVSGRHAIVSAHARAPFLRGRCQLLRENTRGNSRPGFIFPDVGWFLTMRGDRPIMLFLKCWAAWLARDYRLAPSQARRQAPACWRGESKQGGQFPEVWPSSVGCTTWRPCSTSGCRRRPVRHRAPSARAGARCRTVNTGLTGVGGDGSYAAWPSARPGLVRCWFIGIALPLREALLGGLPWLTDICGHGSSMRTESQGSRRRADSVL